MSAGPSVSLRDRAAAVLHDNDAGNWTKAAPHLYPHQWSWDRAFIAIGRAHLDVRRAMAELEQLFAAQWSTGMVPHLVFRGGNPRFRWPLLPSTSPAEPAFQPHNYWRGPIWPVINWLLSHSLSQLGYSRRADELRRDSLGQIAEAGEFAEYYEPFTGRPLGSPRQSWTAAVALDWSAS